MTPGAPAHYRTPQSIGSTRGSAAAQNTPPMGPCKKSVPRYFPPPIINRTSFLLTGINLWIGRAPTFELFHQNEPIPEIQATRRPLSPAAQNRPQNTVKFTTD